MLLNKLVANIVAKRYASFFSFDSWLGALPLFVRKLIAPVEAKSILSALGEEARLSRDGSALGPALGIEIITSLRTYSAGGMKFEEMFVAVRRRTQLRCGS
jgi:hypothetical protein